MSFHGFTLRLPETVYQEVKKRKRKSVTAFVVEAIEEKLAREKDSDIRRGLQSLSGSVDEAEFALWMKAQEEAMRIAGD